MALPEKSILSLDEVITRWRHWGCDHETLHSYAERNLLVFAVYQRDIGSHKSVNVEDGVRHTHEVRTIRFAGPGTVPRRLFYLAADDARRLLEAKCDEQISVGVLYWTPERIKKQATGCLTARYFRREELVVTREQCEVFERKHHASGVTGLIKKLAFAATQPSQQKALKLWGGAIVVVAGALWAVFKWYAA